MFLLKLTSIELLTNKTYIGEIGGLLVSTLVFYLRTRNGDWFLLYQLGKNIDPLIFREFIEALYKKLEAKERGEEEEFLT